ncbi:MAG TPA: hypothetical protein VK255_00780 [Patescibacteria group bacterium]|nr:hypothetical protein [Patescibacteria group bacterium]
MVEPPTLEESMNESIWRERKGEHEALDLILEMSAISPEWCKGFFSEELSHDPEFLLDLIHQLGSFPGWKTMEVQRVLKRLFDNVVLSDDFQWSDDYFMRKDLCDKKFLREVVCQVGQISPSGIGSVQDLLIKCFPSHN